MIITGPLQNAKVMVREKQSEAAEKVMSIEEKFISSNLAIAAALVLLSFIRRRSHIDLA